MNNKLFTYMGLNWCKVEAKYLLEWSQTHKPHTKWRATTVKMKYSQNSPEENSWGRRLR